MVLAKEKIKEFIKGENQAEDSYDYKNIAYSIHQNLGEQKEAERLYLIAETAATEGYEYIEVGNS